MGYVDCDAHVVECDETWDYFDPSERHYRPMRVSADRVRRAGDDSPHHAGSNFAELWLLDDAWCGVVPPDGVVRDNGNQYDPDAIRLRNLPRRVADLDALGIDVQVLQATAFLATQIGNPVAEAAIKRSWNRWMADRLAGSGGRFVWIAEVPTRLIDRAIGELEFAKHHGAVGVHLHGVEHGCYLDDPVFDTLFATMQDLELTLVSHAGRPTSLSPGRFPIGVNFPSMACFVEHMASPMTTFWTVLATDLHDRFPRLRVAINEVGAGWACALEYQHRRIAASAGNYRVQGFRRDIFEERNLFVSCFADEDLPTLVSQLGENVLMTGTDYSHNDAASQLTGHDSITRRTDISDRVAQKLTDTNARRAFGIDADHRPADGVNITRRGKLPHTRAFDPLSANERNIVSIGD
jgi:predicted TIM-barrel fold metal-dependent hydrolase